MTIESILEINNFLITNPKNINVLSVDIGDGYPDFCDAFIDEAEIFENNEWRDATEEELDVINDDSNFVYEAALKQEF